MKKHSFSPQSGFTMLEVLISMVIIAFGLLGVAGLQAFALKNNQSAHFRSVATMLASDIADRMRANPNGAVFDGAYNKPDLSSYPTQGVTNCGNTSGCTSTQLAENDLYEWQLRVKSALPGGEGIICVDSTPNDGVTATSAGHCDNAGVTNYVVKIWWQDDRTRSGDVAKPQRFSTTINP